MEMELFSSLVALMARARAHGAVRNLLRLDAHTLWSVGLTRADVADCLASPQPNSAEFLHARQLRNVRAALAKQDSLGLWIAAAPAAPQRSKAPVRRAA